MVECPRCRGEMREGEAFTRLTPLGGQLYPGFSMAGMTGWGVTSGEAPGEQRVLWREKTGAKTGWIMKSDEEKTMKILGRRCTKCGYVELYAQEET